MIELERRDNLAILRMGHGPANAMDTEFCREVARQMTAADESDAGAVILTGQGEIFSAGVDLPQLLEGGVEYIRQFLTALSEMLESAFFLSKPLISAINGHAIAGGCLLACAADYRLMSTGIGRIGVPELHVGVPFPVAGMELMRAQVSPIHFEEVMLGGATYSGEEAFERGLIDELIDAEQLMSRTEEVAQARASIRPEVYALTKRHTRQPVRTAIDMESHMFGARINALWESEETLQAIESFVAKTLKR